MTISRFAAAVIALSAALLYPGVAHPADFYVDSLTPPGGTGSSSAPLQTIQEGLTRLRPGDTLYIRGDVSGPGRLYSETPSFPVDGLPDAPITVGSLPGERVVVSHANRILLNRAFLVIQGLIFDHQNAGSDAIGISADSVTVSRSEVRNGARDGIDISASASDVTIDDSIIHDFVWLTTTRNDAHCIVASPGAADLRITGNVIYNCSGDGIQLFAEDSTPITSYVHDVLVERNIIYSTLGANSENALDFKGGVNVIVRKNDLYGFTSNKAVVVQKGAQNIRLDENRIHDSDRGAEFRWEGGRFQDGITFTRNLIYNITGTYGLKLDGVFNAALLNNTFHNVTGSSVRVELEGVKSGTIKNNLFHRSGAPIVSGVLSADYSHNGWFSVPAGDLAAAGDTTGTDPLFLNVLGGNFGLRSDSPAIDRGVPVGLPFAGAAPDLGARELVDTVAPAAPVSLRVQ